jgi:serine phosphatase RsbU (regulator of sigma subunit)
MNHAGEEFSAERLIQVVKASEALSPQGTVDAIAAAVDAHRAGFPPNDDMTIVAVKIAP